MRVNFRPKIRLVTNIFLVIGTFVIALVLGISGMISVFKAVYLDKLKLNCACIGGYAKTPLGIISFIENLLMAIMSVLILIT